MMYKNMLRTPNQLRHVDLSFINITMYIKSTQHLKEIISITFNRKQFTQNYSKN